MATAVLEKLDPKGDVDKDRCCAHACLERMATELWGPPAEEQSEELDEPSIERVEREAAADFKHAEALKAWWESRQKQEGLDQGAHEISRPEPLQTKGCSKKNWELVEDHQPD